MEIRINMNSNRNINNNPNFQQFNNQNMNINNQQFNNNQNINSQLINNNNSNNYNNMQQFNDNNMLNSRDDSPQRSNNSDYYRKLNSLPIFQKNNFSLNNNFYQENNQNQNNNNNDDNMNDIDINNQYNQENQDKVPLDNMKRNKRNKQNYPNNVPQDNMKSNINIESDPNYMNYNNSNNEHIKLRNKTQKNLNKIQGNNSKEIEDSKKMEINNFNNNNNPNLNSNVKDSNDCFNVDTVVTNIISSKSIRNESIFTNEFAQSRDCGASSVLNVNDMNANNSNNNNKDTKNTFINKNEYNDFSLFNSTNRNEEDSINRDTSKYAYPTKEELQDDQGEQPSFSYIKDVCPEMSVLADDELPKEIHNHQIVKSSLSDDMCIICLKKKSCEKGHICNFCPLIICDKCVKMIISQYYSSDKHRHSLVLKVINNYKCGLCNKTKFPNNFCFYCDECNFGICLSCYLPSNKNEDDQIHEHSLLNVFDTSLECKKCGEKKKEGIKCNDCNLELCSDCYNEIIDRKRKGYLHEHKMFLNQSDNWTCKECKKSEGKVAFSCKQCNIDYCLNCFLE